MLVVVDAVAVAVVIAVVVVVVAVVAVVADVLLLLLLLSPLSMSMSSLLYSATSVQRIDHNSTSSCRSFIHSFKALGSSGLSLC